jgi:hypothetical protein
VIGDHREHLGRRLTELLLDPDLDHGRTIGDPIFEGEKTRVFRAFTRRFAGITL